MNEQAIWKLAREGGLAALTIGQLAKETGKSALELESLYPEPAFMVLVLTEAAHHQAMETLPDPALPTQDRLTDLVMAHLDACLAHQEAVKRLWHDLLTTPSALLILRPHLLKVVTRILEESGLKSESLWAPIQQHAYLGLFLYVLSVWIDDETPQQEQTLVALDRGLKQLGSMPW